MNSLFSSSRQDDANKKSTPPSTPTGKRVSSWLSKSDTHSNSLSSSTTFQLTPSRLLKAQQLTPSRATAGSSLSSDPLSDPDFSAGRISLLGASPIRSRGAMKEAGAHSPAKAREEAIDMGLYHLDDIQKGDHSFFGTNDGKAFSSRGALDMFATLDKGKAVDKRASVGQVDANAERDDADSMHPPSFAESQFATIIRRQRKRRVFSPTDALNSNMTGHAPDIEAHFGQGRGSDDAQDKLDSDPVGFSDRKGLQLKEGGSSNSPADRNDPHMAAHQAWEFAGWGSIYMLELSASEMNAGDPGQGPNAGPTKAATTKPTVELGQLKASAIAGNAVTGSVFYALPAVVAASSVLSPISMLVACLLLYPFRPIICELASALSASNAGNYSYFSNIAGNTVSLLAAAITMLDAIATAAVSAGTASAYISGEAAESGSGSIISFKLISVLLLVGLAVLCLAGLRDSSNVALTMFTLHIGSMAALIISGSVSWARMGNDTLASNWRQGIATVTASGGKGIARSIFDGVCVAFVGLTGFECTPSYINSVKAGQFPKALRNLHLIVILIEAPLMLLILANLPLDMVLSGSNVLALLGQVTGTGRWLKIFIVIDACAVLCGGIITGAIAFCGLVDTLCDNVVLPRVLALTVPKTGAPYVSLGLFLALSLVMSASCNFDLATLSSVFSVSFLCVMTLFGLALLSLKSVRPSLPREPISGLLVVFAGVAIGIVAMAGNFALAPVIIQQTLIYFIVLAAGLLNAANRVLIAKVILWLANQSTWVQRWKLTAGLSKTIIRWVRKERSHPVIYFSKTDDISVLTNALYYIKNNEQTSNCKLVHCYKSINEIPEQLDETFQLVDEIFPAITVDLVFVEASFTPKVVDAITKKLRVPKSRAFISCPSGKGPMVGGSYKLAEYGGLRIILP